MCSWLEEKEARVMDPFMLAAIEEAIAPLLWAEDIGE